MKPLQGVRVITLEQFGAAPYGTMFLADLGAEVIKVESKATGGDAARYGRPFMLGEADSQYFQGFNTGKRSVVLDLKSPEGRAQFEELVETADAVVNNLRGDQPGKLGLDYASLKAIRPSVVCLHISAFGRDNERASRPGYDFILQAETGLMSLTGEPDGAPARFGPSIVDYMTGMTAMTGLLACLMAARQTGQGCDLDTSLFEVGLHQLNYAATWYLNEGKMSTRLSRSAHFAASPVQTARAADGWVFVMCMTDKFWAALASAVERPAWLTDPRFATNDLRHANRAALTGELDAVFSADTMDSWVARLGGTVPIGPVYDVAQALDSPFVERIGMVRTVPHATRPDFRLLANPLRIGGQRLEQTSCAALGADNAALFGAAETRLEEKRRVG